MMPITISSPSRDYFTVKDLLARWETSPNALLEHGKKGNLKIKLNWIELREREHNKACIHDEPYLAPLIVRNKSGTLDFSSPCWRCPHYKDDSACKFEIPPMIDPSNLTSSEKRDMFRVTVYSNDLIVTREDAEHFEKEFGEKPDLHGFSWQGKSP
jgi:hypothetical protein